MLKSLGQWTASSLKQRKVIPSQLTVPSKLPLSDREQEETDTEKKETEYVTIIIEKCFILTTCQFSIINMSCFLMCYSSHVETPQERSLNAHVTDDIRDVPSTDDNEKLMVQEEMQPHNKSLSKTMDMT